MSTGKNNCLLVIAWNTTLTSVVFLLVDAACYGWIWKDPDCWERLLYTVVLAFAYSYIYINASYIWASNSTKTFVIAYSGKLSRFGNGLIFGLLSTLVVLSAIAFLDVVASTLYVHFLHGIRGALPPPDTQDSIDAAAKLLLASATLEHIGKTEDDPRQP